MEREYSYVESGMNMGFFIDWRDGVKERGLLSNYVNKY